MQLLVLCLFLKIPPEEGNDSLLRNCTAQLWLQGPGVRNPGSQLRKALVDGRCLSRRGPSLLRKTKHSPRQYRNALPLKDAKSLALRRRGLCPLQGRQRMVSVLFTRAGHYFPAPRTTQGQGSSMQSLAHPCYSQRLPSDFSQLAHC